MARNAIPIAALAALANALVAQAAVPMWGQCGGNNWTGETECVSGAVCVFQNEWYHQCLAGTTTASSTSTSTSTTSTSTTSTSTSISSSSSTPISSDPPTSTSTTPDAPVPTPPFDLVGYAAGTTGGGNANPIPVSSCSAFKTAVTGTQAAVVQISGTLSGCGIIDVQSNKSIIGVGSNAGFTGGGIRIRDSSNVIIRNLVFKTAPKGGDLIALDGATRVWIDHNDFSNAGLTGDKDYYDGLLDITHAADYVSVTWNRFHDHWKGSLVGHSDSNSGEDTGHLRVTYAYNYWNNVNSRLPSLRFGTGHIFNSHFSNSPTSGINSRMGARVLVENSIFTNVALAIVTDLDSDQEGYATSRGNVFNNSPTRITQTGHTNPPYSYTLLGISGLENIVNTYSGTGRISGNGSVSSVSNPPSSSSTRTSSTSTRISSTSTRTSTSSTRPPSSTSTSTDGNTGPVPSGLVGYAAGTTGGGSASAVTVSSCGAFESAVTGTQAAVVRISGTLSGCGIIDVDSNKTILGVGSNSGFTGGGIRIRDSSNVIIRNLVFKTAPKGGDLIALDGATRVWIDHSDFSNAGLTGDKDYYDGLLDITHASDFVSITWNRFHDHWKGSLVGHSDSNGGEDSGHLRITYAYNHWSNVNSRLPSLRFGTGHIFNSYFTNSPTSGINSRMGARVLVENNVFNSVALAIVTDLDSDQEGYATSRGNIFTNSPTRITQTGHTTPPYSYTLLDASNVQSTVSNGSGTGKITV